MSTPTLPEFEPCRFQHYGDGHTLKHDDYRVRQIPGADLAFVCKEILAFGWHRVGQCMIFTGEERRNRIDGKSFYNPDDDHGYFITRDARVFEVRGCAHQWVDRSGPERRMRGYHDYRCSLCGKEKYVDSSG